MPAAGAPPAWPAPGCEAAVEALERFAGGAARAAGRIRAGRRDVAAPLTANPAGCLLSELRPAAAAAIERGAEPIGESAAAAVGHPGARRSRSLRAREQRRQVPFLRDIAGNPFRPVAFPLAWRAGTAVALARRTYDPPDVSAMPILAAALEDAGCDSAEVPGRGRGDGPHVRGCRLADNVLGEE